MHKSEMMFACVNNDILVNEIRLYIDSVNIPNLKNKIVHVCVSRIEDTTVYELNYATSAFGLISMPSTFYIKADEEIIAFSYVGVHEVGRVPWRRPPPRRSGPREAVPWMIRNVS